MMHRHEQGFSMVEIIVTMVIISILTVMASPNFKRVAIQENLNRSAVDLSTVLQKAESRAVLEGRVITVFVGTEPTLTATQLSWMPSGKAYLRDGAQTIFVSAKGYLQTTATNIAYVGTKSFIICSEGATSSRKITYNRIGVVVDSGLRENCNAD